MKIYRDQALPAGIGALLLAGLSVAATTTWAGGPPSLQALTWDVVVNNGDYMPTDSCDPAAPQSPPCRRFNSYNQPSVNARGLVVFRARSRGGSGGQPVHGVYTRDMEALGPVVKTLDRDTEVPQPNNRGEQFIEPPSFPRIDITSDTIGTRGNHQPVWQVQDEEGEIVEQLGTTGIYATPHGPLITAASKLGGVPAFSFFAVPEAPGTAFDVFPGAPAVTDGATIAFKGNYTVGVVAKTGVYYRDLEDQDITDPDGEPLGPAGGNNPVVLIANNTDTLIPGTNPPVVFGSTAPPSAANREAVFAGFDNEDNPTSGGIYLAPLVPYPLAQQPKLKTLVSIGSKVPGEANAQFNRLGEGVAFDGRLVAFWGAWGAETTTLRLYCPNEGNQARIAYCKSTASGSTFDPDVDNWYQERQVPDNQGIFVHDTKSGQTTRVARTGGDFADFVYWNFSGRAPGQAAGEDDEGELARWRSATFAAVAGHGGASYRSAFKARSGLVDPLTHVYVNPVDGIYLVRGPGQPKTLTVVQTGMPGTLLDSEAVDPDTEQILPITEVGIERDALRGKSLVINASMGTEEAGWAGIYLARLPKP